MVIIGLQVCISKYREFLREDIVNFVKVQVKIIDIERVN